MTDADTPATYVSRGQQEAITEAFAPVREYVEGLDQSRERSLALTKLDEAKMWAFAHHRVNNGGDA